MSNILKKKKFKPIKWVVLNNQNSFLKYKKNYQKSFYKVFKRKINWPNLLNFASNKFDAVLGLNEKNEIIASTFLIPGILKNKNNIKYYGLIINSFVFQKYSNGYLTYKKMINLIKKIAVTKKYDLLMGFPNHNAFKLLVLISKFEVYGRGKFLNLNVKKLKIIKKINNLFFLSEPDLVKKIKKSNFNFDGNVIFKYYRDKKEIFDFKNLNSIKYKNKCRICIWEKDLKKINNMNKNYLLNFCVFFIKKRFLIKKSALFSDIFWETKYNNPV